MLADKINGHLIGQQGQDFEVRIGARTPRHEATVEAGPVEPVPEAQRVPLLAHEYWGRDGELRLAAAKNNNTEVTIPQYGARARVCCASICLRFLSV